MSGRGRLGHWAAALFAAPLIAGLAGLADAGWVRLFPGLGVAVPWLVGAAALVCLAVVVPALHPRFGRWGETLAALPPVLPLGLAVLLAPPTGGRGLLRLGWAASLLLLAWVQSRGLVRNTGRRGPAAESALVALGGLVVTGAIRVVVDRALGSGMGVTGSALAAMVGAAALLWAALAWQATVVRRSVAAGAQVDRGFRREWWLTLPAVVAVSLLPGALVPTYPAPLRGSGMGRLVVRFIEVTAGRSPRLPTSAVAAVEAGRAAGTTGVWLAVGCLLVLILVWPARPLLERLLDRLVGMTSLTPPPTPPWRQRLRGWWLALREGWLPRRPARMPAAGRRWRSLPPDPGPRIAVPAGRAPGVVPQGERERVRAAYARFLRAARGAGLARAPAHTPRRFLAWVGSRAAAVRFPLETLTGRYERARYADAPVSSEESEAAEHEARAAAYVLDVAQLQLRRTREGPAEAGLRWTAPRGVDALRRRGGSGP